MKKLSLILASSCFLLGAAVIASYFIFGFTETPLKEEIFKEISEFPSQQEPSVVETQPEIQETSKPKEEESEQPLPQEVTLEVPFTSQAPYGDWSQPWQDACEEANIVMAMRWVNRKSLTKDEADQEILDLVDFQTKNYGDYHSTNAKDTARIFRDFYSYDKIELRYNIGAKDIKKELAEGRIIIAPMAGRLLGNPYFTPPGPAYHMLSIKGYDDETQEFITNDPGTRMGENFRYLYYVIENAIHDWIGSKETIEQGLKVIIILSKN